MERLTEKHYLGTDHYMKCSGSCNVDMDCIDCPSFDCLVERLAAYEDTGLEPESVEALKLSMMGKEISEITTMAQLADCVAVRKEAHMKSSCEENATKLVLCGCNVMGRLWDYCAFCGKRIETGEMCYGLPNGESVCTDCCVAENEGVAVSNGDEEREYNNG